MLHNQILSNKKTKKKLPWILISFGLFAFFCIVSVFGFYGISFKDFSIIADTEKFGQFGDFIGGTLNPILAFLSFMALLYTIKIQTDELKLSREELEATRKELEGSRIAQQEQSESLKLQNEATKLQMFENTFYNLLNHHNNILEKLNYILVRTGENKMQPEAGLFKDILGDLSSSELNYENICFSFKSKNKGTMKIYFMTLFQLLKFIDIESKKLPIDANLYTNIIRATLNDKVLILLALNSVVNEYKKYKEFLTKYYFLEHLNFISSDDLHENVKKIIDDKIKNEYKL